MAHILKSKKDPDPHRALHQWVEKMGKTLPTWVDGQTVRICSHCKDSSKKRHNCRLCGQIFCSLCSAKYHLPAQFNVKNKRLPDGSIPPARVCWKCYENVIEFKFKDTKTTGHLLDQLNDRKKRRIFVPVWQSIKDAPECFRCNSTNKCRICRACGFVFCSNSSCAVKMLAHPNIPKAFEKDPALQNKMGPNFKTHICLQCRWHVVSGTKLIDCSRKEWEAQRKKKKGAKSGGSSNGSSSGSAADQQISSPASHIRSVSVASRGADVMPPATFMRIKEDELLEREMAENAMNDPIKVEEGGVHLEVRWEHDGTQGYPLCCFDAPPDTPLERLVHYIRKKQLIPPHIVHYYTCREKIIPAVFNELFSVKMIEPILYIRRGLSLPESNYEYDEPDAKYNLVYEEKLENSSATGEDDPDSQNSSSVNSPPGGTNPSVVRHIRCATLHKLVEKVTREAGTDLELRFVFFLTYPSFCKPTELLHCLWTRYNVPEPPNFEQFTKEDAREFRSRVRRIQIKVFSVLKYWMDEYWSDFMSPSMQRARANFVEDLQTVPSAAEDPSSSSLNQRPLSLKFAEDLKVLMEKKSQSPDNGGDSASNGSPGNGGGSSALHSSSSNSSSISSLATGSSSSTGPMSNVSGAEDGGDYPPLLMSGSVQAAEIEQKFSSADIKGWEHEIARQLMLVDFSVFSKIKPREFLDNAWSGKHKESRAPNILRMIDHFNRVCSWVQYTVLSNPTPAGRAKLMQSFIKIAEHCGEMNNFNSMFAIFCALRANPLHRLKRTKDLIKARSAKRLEAIRILFKPDNNSRNYREALRHVTKACTPHLGIFLTDLIYIHDGNPEIMFGMINLKKRRLLADRVRWIKQYQQLAPRFRPIAGVQAYFEEHLIARTEDELWDFSLKVEPRSQQ